MSFLGYINSISSKGSYCLVHSDASLCHCLCITSPPPSPPLSNTLPFLFARVSLRGSGRFLHPLQALVFFHDVPLPLIPCSSNLPQCNSSHHEDTIQGPPPFSSHPTSFVPPHTLPLLYPSHFISTFPLHVSPSLSPHPPCPLVPSSSEGDGSLLALLKAQGWATDLSAGVGEGGYERTTLTFVFAITFTLTQSGRENVSETRCLDCPKWKGWKRGRDVRKRCMGCQ